MRGLYTAYRKRSSTICTHRINTVRLSDRHCRTGICYLGFRFNFGLGVRSSGSGGVEQTCQPFYAVRNVYAFWSRTDSRRKLAIEAQANFVGHVLFLDAE